MKELKFEKCSDIEGLYIVEPDIVSDERGYNVRTYNLRDFKAVGLDMDFVDEMQSMSKQGVIRGLHFQKTFQQGKLVRVVSGEVFDVAVDIREGSKTFGRWFGVVLSAVNKSVARKRKSVLAAVYQAARRGIPVRRAFLRLSAACCWACFQVRPGVRSRS